MIIAAIVSGNTSFAGSTKHPGSQLLASVTLALFASNVAGLQLVIQLTKINSSIDAKVNYTLAKCWVVIILCYLPPDLVL